MKLTGKEVLAWMILLLSILFFSATVAFADDGKLRKRHISMVKTVNGKTISIDTTFTATDAEPEKVMEDINKRFGMDDESTTMITRDKKGKDKKKEKSSCHFRSAHDGGRSSEVKV